MHNEEVRAPTGLRYAEYLKDLALDMRWSWNPEADELWSQLDPDLWDRTHNPWVLLQTIRGIDSRAFRLIPRSGSRTA